MKKILFPAIFFILISRLIVAQPGILDGDFDADGKVTTDLGTNEDIGCSAAIQPDGKIIVAGYTSASTFDAALVRYNPDGSIDQSFGSDGTVIIDVGTQDDYLTSIVLQVDGQILAGGYTGPANGSNYLIIRLNPDGSFDNSFSFDGVVTSDIAGSSDVLNSVALGNDGKIIASGCSWDLTGLKFSTARYNTDGSLDLSFDGDGKKLVSIGNDLNDVAYGVAVQPDGKIVVAGYSYNNSQTDISLVRYNFDGSLDQSFSYDGKVMTDIQSSSDHALAVMLQPDGKIVLTGRTHNTVNWDVFIVRYNQDGSLDLTFSEDGKQVKDVSGFNDEGYSLVLQPDGKILVAGLSVINTTANFMLMRIDSAGSLDTTFANEGISLTPFSVGHAGGRSVMLQPNGRIVVAGYASMGGVEGWDFAVARYLSGLNIGITDFAENNNSVFICPNPVKQDAALRYTLPEPEVITIQLFDLSGRLIKTISSNERQAEGEHEVALSLDPGLSAGSYLLVISSPQGKIGVKLMKE